MLERALAARGDVVTRSFSMDHSAVDQFMELYNFRLLDDLELLKPYRVTITHHWGDDFIRDNYHMGPDKFWKAMFYFSPKTIILNRKNLLRRFISHMIAIEKGFGVNKPRKKHRKIKLDMGELLLDIKNTSRYRDRVVQANPGSLVIYYEDLVEDWPGTWRKIQEFAGMDPMDVAPQTYKQQTKPLRKIIKNYGHIAPWLRFLGYGGWLDDEV